MTGYTTTELNEMKATELRQLAASYRVKGASRGRKSDLIPAIIAHETEMAKFGAFETNGLDAAAAKLNGALTETPEEIAAQTLDERLAATEETRNETYAGEAEALATQLAATDFKAAASVKAQADAMFDAGVEKAKQKVLEEVRKENERRTAQKKCAVCGTRKIDHKTQGLDSTMCEPCFEAAGIENEHTDGLHADAPNAACPDCEFDQHSDEILIDHPKADALAKFAKANGWKVSYFARKGETVELLVSPVSGDESLTIVWTGRVFQYELSSHRSNGKDRKVRNVSAARKLIAES